MFKNKNYLTSAQKQLIPTYLEKWKNISFSVQPIDQQEITKYIRYFYNLNNKSKPVILFFDSPRAAIEHLISEPIIDLVSIIPNLFALNQLKSHIINPHPILSQNLETEINQLLTRPLEDLINRRIKRLYEEEFIELLNKLQQQTEDESLNQIIKELMSNNLTKAMLIQIIWQPQTNIKSHPEIVEAWQTIVSKPDALKGFRIKEISALLFQDYPEYRENYFCQTLAPFCSSIDFQISVLKLKADLEKWNILKSLVKYCSYIFPLENFCLVCSKPKRILLDFEKQLHANGEPAIEFNDGWLRKYFYHGILLPEKYGKLPQNEWCSEWLLSENNALLRRALIQGIGYVKICQDLKSILLDSWREYELLKINQDIDMEPVVLLKMVCPSTNQIYILRVRPDFTSAREAIRWVNWGIDPEDFVIET